MQLNSLVTTVALVVFTSPTRFPENEKELKTVELSTHSLSISWLNFDERARSFVATIFPLDDNPTVRNQVRKKSTAAEASRDIR